MLVDDECARKNATDFYNEHECETFTNGLVLINRFWLPTFWNQLEMAKMLHAIVMSFFGAPCTHCSVCKAQMFQPSVSQIYTYSHPKALEQKMFPQK